MSAPDAPFAECASVEFKAHFDVKHEWCELIKDIVALANSGGGQIFVGVNDDASPSGSDVSQLLAVDLADVINKIRGFTDVNFSGVAIRAVTYAEARIAEIVVLEFPTPLVFGKTGNYTDANNKPQCAFRQGMLYVRHGPKSEPATSDDIRTLIQIQLERQRNALLTNLRQVIEAPANSVVKIVNEASSAKEGGAGTAVRIVDDSTAKEAMLLDVNTVHPYRQKEVVGAINGHFAGSIRITTNDNVAIRRLHK